MTIFDDIGKGFKKVGEEVFVKPVNNIGKGVKDAGSWFVNAGEDIFHEVKGDVGALFNWGGDRFDNVFNNPTIIIVAGIILVAVLFKK